MWGWTLLAFGLYQQYSSENSPAFSTTGSRNEDGTASRRHLSRSRQCKEHSNPFLRTVDSTSIAPRKRDLMKPRPSLCPILLLLAILFVFPRNAPAQNVPPLDKIQNQQDLDRAITALDAALFDAYNKCDLVKFASFID